MSRARPNHLFDHWMAECKRQLARGVKRSAVQAARCAQIVEDFDTLPLQGEGTKPRVGVVGEILVKFHPTANNQIVDVIEREGCEAVVPGLIEFFLFGIAGGIFQKDPLGQFRQEGALGGKDRACRPSRSSRKPVNDALAEVDALQPAGEYLSSWPNTPSEILAPVQLDGRGLAAHRRDGGAHSRRARRT